MLVNSATGRSAAFYSVLTVGLIILASKSQYLVVPEGLGARIGHNSEALGFALLFCILVQFIRPWARSRTPRWVPTIGVFAALMTGYFVLHFLVPVTSLSTLDEAFSGAAYVWLYMMIPSRFRSALVSSAIVLVFIILLFDTTFVLEQAESLVPLLIAPVALDVIDRTILDPAGPDRRAVRAVWILSLAAVGLTFMLAAPWAREDLHGAFRYMIDYGQRASEAYWAWILIHLYFGYLLPPSIRREERSDIAAAEGR